LGSNDEIFDTFCRDCVTEHLAMETMTALEEINCRPLLKILSPIALFDFSSRQSFEEQSKFINMTMKLYDSLLCMGVTLACIGFTGHI